MGTTIGKVAAFFCPIVFMMPFPIPPPKTFQIPKTRLRQATQSFRSDYTLLSASSIDQTALFIGSWICPYVLTVTAVNNYCAAAASGFVCTATVCSLAFFNCSVTLVYSADGSVRFRSDESSRSKSDLSQIALIHRRFEKKIRSTRLTTFFFGIECRLIQDDLSFFFLFFVHWCCFFHKQFNKYINHFFHDQLEQ